MDKLITSTYFSGPLSALRLIPDEEINESAIYRAMIYSSMFNQLDNYNYLVTQAIKSLLCGEYVRNNNIVDVKDIIVEFPNYSLDSKKKILMRPLFARSTGQNYMCRVHAVCTIYDANNKNNFGTSTEFLGFLPCMVGSSRCITGYKPDWVPSLDEWKHSLGEAIPPGYFIRNGHDVAMLLTVRQSTDTILITRDKKGKILTRVTEFTKGETTVIRMIEGKNKASIKMLCSHIPKKNKKDKHYPIFVVYYILLSKEIFNINKITESILSFAPKNERPYIKAYLLTSINKFENLLQPNESGRIDKDKCIKEYIFKKNTLVKDSRHLSEEENRFSIDGIRNILFREILPSVTINNSGDLYKKIATLSLIVCEHIRACIGVRPLDNIDHCKNKKLDDFFRILEQYIIRKLKPAIITKTPFVKWYTGKKDSGENIVEPLKEESFPLILSTYAKANVTADDRNKSFAIRQVQTTGYGPFDPVNTSEGKRCGMTSHISICTRISWNSEYIPDLLDPINALSENLFFSSESGYIFLYEEDDTAKFLTKKIRNEETTIYLTVECCGHMINYFYEKNSPVKFRKYNSCIIIGNVDLLDPEDIEKFTLEYSKDIYCVLFYEDQDLKKLRAAEGQVYISKKDAISLMKKHGKNIERTEDRIIEFVYPREEKEKEDETQKEEDETKTEEGTHKIATFFNNSIKMNVDKNTANYLSFCLSLLNENCCTFPNNKYNHMFIANNKISCIQGKDNLPYPQILWYDPKYVVSTIKGYIRSEILPIDTCVYASERKIYYRYDSGRMLCPFLILDEDGNLILDQKPEIAQKWNGKKLIDYSNVKNNVKELFREGIMEYVDMKYLDMTFIADSVTECRRFTALRRLLNNTNLENSDPYFEKSPGNVYFNEDISFVKIHKKKYNIVFAAEKQKENQVNYNDELFAYYKFPYTLYKPFEKEIIVLEQEDDTTKRDGFDLCYYDGEKIVWIKENINFFDEMYNGNQIIDVRFKNSRIKEVYIEQFQDKVVLVDVNLTKIKNTGKKFFTIEENGKISWKKSILEGNNLIEDDRIGKFYYQTEQKEMLIPVTELMTYEHFDLNGEKEYFDKLEKKNEPNDRECDFLMTFRRNQEHLDQIDLTRLEENGYVSEIFNFLRSKYVQFRKKSNIYKIMRYLNYRFKFTHCPIDPNIIYSAAANLSIKANHNQGPRFTYQCQMIKQSLSIVDPVYFSRFSAAKQAMQAEQNLVESIAEEPLYGVTIASSVTGIVATMTDEYGYEDALTVSEEFVFRYAKPSIITIIEKDEDSGKFSEYISYPKDDKGCEKKGYKYRHLDENGLPRYGSVIEVGDCICGMMRKSGQNVSEISVYAKVGHEGVVVQILGMVNEDGKNTKMTHIKILNKRNSILGSKIAGRHAQKGTLCHVNKAEDQFGENIKVPGYYLTGGDFSFLEQIVGEDIVKAVAEGKLKFKVVGSDHMPKIVSGPNAGCAIDIVFSPFSYPSRMTMGMNYEKMGSKAALRLQRKMDGTNFHKNQISMFEQVLADNGLDKHGCEMLAHSDGEIIMDVTTGKPLRVYICPCSYKKLRHDPDDKISIRHIGKRDPVTDQGVHGRQEEGAQRVGEMEKDALMSQKAAALALERLMYASDVYHAVFCKACGRASSESNLETKACKMCNSQNSLVIMTQTRIFRLVCQYLEACGISIKMLDPRSEHGV